jgi:lipopolysaccharide export LptBFGC system permease protein LptF
MRPIIVGFGLLILCLLILFQIGEVNFIKGNVKLEVVVAIVAFIFFFVGLYFNYQAQKKPNQLSKKLLPARSLNQKLTTSN